jgi:penicillin amidase
MSEVGLKTSKVLSAVLLIAVIAFVVMAYRYIVLLAPFSGELWREEDVRRVASPYGYAEVYYDEYGVPHIKAENERALSFAVGYVQARDRLFQMDLHRRMMRGQLSEIFGEELVESDVFHIKMDFLSSAKATWEEINGTEFGDYVMAYCDGVNAYIVQAEKDGTLPMEFKLLNYKPELWKPEDTFLIAKEIAWGLTGDFNDIERAIIAEKLPSALELYPEELNHSYPIVRTGKVSSELLEWLRPFEKEDGVGSNNWIISGKYTSNGMPILANDPHLSLTVPPVWFEMHLISEKMNVRGVTFPGVPLIIIGQNEHVAWGFTNVGADVIDFYYYVTDEEGNKYLYKGEWKNFDIEERTLRVKTKKGIEERKVIVKKTIHGPVIDRGGKEVAVAWTGLSATREFFAIYTYNHAGNMEEFLEGVKYFDVPAQNLVYIDDEGNTMYYPAGRFPLRYINGKLVPGNIIFNGSAGEGEWIGFKPYGKSTWEGFIPFDEIPHLINPDYVATANQRVVFDYQYYLGDSSYFTDPYRGMRIYEMLDKMIDSGRKIDVKFVMDMQRDVYSKPAEFFVNQIREENPPFSEKALSYANELLNWDYKMRRNSKQALIFAIWLKHYLNETFYDEFSSAGLDESYYPKYWVLQNLDSGSKWFDDIRTEEIETKADIMARAMDRAVKEIETDGYRVYGDYNKLNMNHPFGEVLRFLNYPNLPMDGSEFTVFNFRAKSTPFQIGSSWRMISTFDKSYCILPGGNSGRYLSENYDDQLEKWANGEYREMGFEIKGAKTIVFEALKSQIS